MHRDEIDAALATRLVAEQFPQWADLAVAPVEVEGWDNRTFRLGRDLSIRLPSAAGYVPSVEKEQTWLPRLAGRLPLPIPVPVGAGVPSELYPWPWSIRRWIEGRSAAPASAGDSVEFATALAGFLRALQQVDARDGPIAGEHSFHRGGDLSVYDAETRAALVSVASQVDPAAATEVWDAALVSRWTGAPVWFHGDVAAGNLLLDDRGALAAVIDFGTCGVGDPACDLVIAWTLFDGQAREAFRAAMAVDSAMWARARGWALWKALITLAGADPNSPVAQQEQRIIGDVLAEGSSGCSTT